VERFGCAGHERNRPAVIASAVLANRHRCMHYRSMTSITIRDVPEEVRDELAARARLSGRSLQEFLRAELSRLASQPDPDALMARVRERTRRTGSRLSASQIVAHRDHDRR
jgi:plasmid stability protein